MDSSSTDNHPSESLQTQNNTLKATQQLPEFFSANPKRSISKVVPSLLSSTSSTHTAQHLRTDQSESVNMSAPDSTSPADQSFQFDSHVNTPAWALAFQQQFHEYDGKFAQYNDRLAKMEQLVAENAQLRATLNETQVALEEAQLLIQSLQNGSNSSALSPVATKPTLP
jgi:cell shape-determining protein MreC